MAILAPTTGPTVTVQMDDRRRIIRRIVNYTFIETLIVADAVYPLVLADMTGWRGLAVHMGNEIDVNGDIRCYAAFADDVVIETGLFQLAADTLDNTIQKWVLACSDSVPSIYATTARQLACPPYVLVTFDSDGDASGGDVLTLNLVYSR